MLSLIHIYKNTDIAFYMSRVGAPACVAGFEEIIAMGAKKFVLFGSCGVLDDGKVKDRIIIPVAALRDEGTSYHYLASAPEIEAAPASIQAVEHVLASLGYSCLLYTSCSGLWVDMTTQYPFFASSTTTSIKSW